MEASILLVIGLALLQVDVGVADYNCEGGVYKTLYKLTEDCRKTNYAPYLKSMRKKQPYISGRDVTQSLREYCKVADEVTACVQTFVDVLPCLGDQQEYFDSLMLNSNWFCEGKELKEAMASVFDNLPLEHLDYRENECYRETPQKAYECVRRYLKPENRGDIKATQKKTMSSFRCTFRKLAKVCPRDSAFLFTTIEYDYLIVPPALGLNISQYILNAASIQLD